MMDVDLVSTKLRRMTAVIGDLKRGTSGDDAAKEAGTLAELCEELELLHKYLGPATLELLAISKRQVAAIKQVEATGQEVATEKRAEKSNWRAQLLADLLRLGLLGLASLVFAFIALGVGRSAGLGPIVAANAYIGAILLLAGFRSDDTYQVGNPATRLRATNWVDSAFEFLYPSRAAAIFLVAALFIALWLGFANVYEHYVNPDTVPNADGFDAQSASAFRRGAEPVIGAAVSKPLPEPDGVQASTGRNFTWDEARSLSFLTLAAFDGPGQRFEGELRTVVLYELADAIFLILGIFALLINRLSELD